MRSQDQTKDIDWITVFIYLGLVLTGWLMIYASEYNINEPKSIFDTGTSAGKQFIFICVSLFLGLITLLLESKFYRSFAYVFYGVGIFMLLVVLLFAREVNGARAWLDLGGGFKLQASEFAKTCTALALAGYLGSYNVNLKNRSAQIRAIAIILVPILIILAQQDAGAALVYLALQFVLFRAGFPAFWYVLEVVLILLFILALVIEPYFLILAIVLAGLAATLYTLGIKKMRWLLVGAWALISFFLYKAGWQVTILSINSLATIGFVALNWKKKWQQGVLILAGVVISSIFVLSTYFVFYKVLKPHQQNRILTWLKPESLGPDGKEGIYYNLYQSKRAISSGGASGKGFLSGTITKLNYVPEQNTDFIFCTIGEEQGFLGSLLLIGLFATLLLRIIYMAERQRSDFSRYYAYGVASILFFNFFINIGMTIGLMPIIGIPLPFISYGGSSLISFTLLLGVLVKLDSDRLLVFR